MAIHSSFEHSGKQIGTLTVERLDEAFLPIPPGLAGGFASVPIQSFCFIIQHKSARLEHRPQMGANRARCQLLTLSPSRYCFYMHKYIHSLPPFSLASPMLLWPDKPSLFICYYIGVVGSKNRVGACGVSQHCWLNIRVFYHFPPLRPLISFTITLSINKIPQDARKPHNVFSLWVHYVCGCVCVCALQNQINHLHLQLSDFSLPLSCLATCTLHQRGFQQC